MKKGMVLFLSIILVLALAGCNGAKKGGDTITIGSKNFTENILLAHIMADVIENDGNLKVIRKVNLGGSNVAWKALLNNDIQLYPDYTGTITANYYQAKTGNSQETLAKTRELVKQDKLVFSSPFGFNNTYTLAVTKQTAEKYNLKSFSDLTKVSKDLVLGCDFEFIDRPDGYPGLQKIYGMTFKDVKGMDHGISYRSIVEKQVDVVNAFSTDGQISINGLVILEDDKSFFPPYDAGAIVKEEVIKKYPEIQKALDKLEGVITEADMQELNAKVDSEGLKAENVARDFLKKKGLIK